MPLKHFYGFLLKDDGIIRPECPDADRIVNRHQRFVAGAEKSAPTEMRYSTMLGSPKFPAAISAVIPQSSAAFTLAPNCTSNLRTSSRSAFDFPRLYPSIQAYPAACIRAVSLWLDSMFGSAP